jgi:hypothetical protein
VCRVINGKRLISLTTALLACLGVVACGNTTGGDKSTDTVRGSATTVKQSTTTAIPTADATPAKVLATVGRTPITLGAVERLMVQANAPTPVPDPPSYSACVAQLRAEPPRSGISPATQSDAQLKRACHQHYEELLQAALRTAIHNQWVVGEATEEGVRVSQPEIEHEFDVSRRSFGTDAKFEAYRKGTKETIADMMFELKLTQLTDKILRKVREKESVIDDAAVARYYDSHRQQFAIPQGRAVRIVRTATRGSAQKVKKELQSGKSFASVAKELSAIGQPLGAKSGEVADLKPGIFEEKNLNDAIFTARLNHLYGPFELTASHKTIAPETNTGFFLYEVTHVIPGNQKPLTQAKSAIAAELTAAQKTKTLATFITAYRRKWKARTNCQAGYVVKFCKQFTAKGEEAPTIL